MRLLPFEDSITRIQRGARCPAHPRGQPGNDPVEIAPERLAGERAPPVTSRKRGNSHESLVDVVPLGDGEVERDERRRGLPRASRDLSDIQQGEDIERG